MKAFHLMPLPARRAAAAVTLLLGLLGALTDTVSAAPVAVSVENATEPTRCAEEDNVSFNLDSRAVRSFRLEALPPAYLPRVRQDTTAPDFSGCNFDGSAHPTDPRHSFEPRQVVLHDGARWRIVGITLPSFWRPQRVPLTVDGRADGGFHMVQVFQKQPGGDAREIIVFYPSDGYWRIKPVPEARFGDGVYGSSVLLGPVRQAGRPVVDIESIAIRTAPLAIRLRFEGGGSAALTLVEASRARTALDVRLSRPAGAGARFAVLRSMYVAPDNADMSELSWRPRATAALRTRWLPEVTRVMATELRFGRSVVSRHNTSAPDMRFSRFDDHAAAAPAPPRIAPHSRP